MSEEKSIRDRLMEEDSFEEELERKSIPDKINNDEETKGKVSAFEWIKVIVIAVAIALIINFFVIVNSVVPTGSMENTIMAGSRMIGLRFSYYFSEPSRGDIIIFKNPDNTDENYVKRVIGLPGDTVQIINGVTYVNDEVLEEPYLKEEMAKNDWGPYEVPEASYFVMGDNRNNSKDSRYWSTTNYVPEDYILGKAVLVYYPFSDFGVIK